MSEPLTEFLKTSFGTVRDAADVDSIIGKPILAGEITAIPISRVSLGFAGGGSDFPGKNQSAAYGGGTATGVTITPIAFLILQGGTARILPVEEPAATSVERVISMIPELTDRLTELWKESKGKSAGNCGS